MKTVGLFYDHWAETRNAPVSFRRPFQLWKKVVWYKANPRTADYMKALLTEHHPNAQFVDWTRRLMNDIGQADVIVLLYPDSIGLGFAAIERDLARRASNPRIEVLNGRRRQFEFDSAARHGLRFRRFLEWTMLVECVSGAAVIIATPFLLLYDMVRGRT